MGPLDDWDYGDNDQATRKRVARESDGQAKMPIDGRPTKRLNALEVV